MKYNSRLNITKMEVHLACSKSPAWYIRWPSSSSAMHVPCSLVSFWSCCKYTIPINNPPMSATHTITKATKGQGSSFWCFVTAHDNLCDHSGWTSRIKCLEGDNQVKILSHNNNLPIYTHYYYYSQFTSFILFLFACFFNVKRHQRPSLNLSNKA